LTDTQTVELPKQTDCYTLSAKTMRSEIMQLNGNDLTIFGTAGLPDLSPVKLQAGTVALAPGSCTFLVL